MAEKAITEDSFIYNQDIDFFTQYNVYRNHIDKHDPFVKGIPMIFVTTPKLNFEDVNINSDAFLTYLKTYEPDILKSLTTLTSNPVGSFNSPFIKILTNTCLSIDSKDTVARTKETGETFYGYKQTLPAAIIDSLLGDEISVKYKEFKDLPIIKMHKAWLEYTEHIRRGLFIPTEHAVKNKYIDYLSSLYYFLLDFDGETILYWAKYTGIAPLNVPYSSLSGDINDHSIPDITINYIYSYKEDMNPSIFRDFNKTVFKVGTLNWFDVLENKGSNYNKVFIHGFKQGKPKNPIDFTSEDAIKKSPLIIRSRYEDSTKDRFKLIFVDDVTKFAPTSNDTAKKK